MNAKFRKLLLYLVLVPIFLVTTNIAQACSCAAFPQNIPQAVAIAYGRADVIFVGDVVNVRTKFLRLPQVRESSFLVRDRWKGSINDTVIVQTNVGESACGYTFRKNASYLVFAYWNPRKTILTTSLCELTRSEDSATDVITELDKLAKRQTAKERS
jgi:hypothetical protein